MLTIDHGNVHWRSDRHVSPKCPDKEIVQRGKISLSWRKVFSRVCSPYNMDETACKRYVQHLEFLDAKAKKKSKRKKHSSAYFLENWKRCKGVFQKAGENMSKAKQILRYVETRLSWFIEVSPTHAVTFSVRSRDAIEDEESLNSCQDNTVIVMTLYCDVRDRVILKGCSCLYRGGTPTGKLGMGKSMGGNFFQGEMGLKVVASWKGDIRTYFTLEHISPISLTSPSPFLHY